MNLFSSLVVTLVLVAPLVTMASVNVDRIEGNQIFFASATPDAPAPPPLSTGLHALQVHQVLEPEKSLPYILMSAMPCQNCQEQRALYLMRTDGQDPHTFVMPGKVQDRKTQSTLVESRGFAGRCVANEDPVYVSFQTERVDRRRKMQTSVFVARVTSEGVREKVYEGRRASPTLKKVLEEVKKSRCTEIGGWNRNTASFKLGGNEKETEPKISKEQ